MLGGSLRALPFGALAALALLGATLIIPAPRRPRAFHAWQAFLLTATLLLPPVAVMAGGRIWAEPVAAVIGIAALVIAFLAGRFLTRTISRGRTAALLLIALLSPLWLGLGSRLVPAASPGHALASSDGRRVVILGLDGATWSIIDPMLGRGELPGIASLTARGARATLNSLEPTLSNRVWTSASTGVVPERHGITDFFLDRRFVRVPTIWDLVDAAGGRVGLFEYLVTEPPLEVDGFVLPGWMAYNPTDSWPPNLVHRLRLLGALHHPFSVVRYRAAGRDRDPRTGVRDLFQAELIATVFMDLHARYSPDVSACIWYGTDRLGHTTWRYHDPASFADPIPPGGKRFRTKLTDYYRAADREIARVVRSLDDGNTLFILMSDHGMGPMESVRLTGYVRGTQILEALDLSDRFYLASPHSEIFVNARLESRVPDWTVTPEAHAAAVDEAAAAFRSVRLADDDTPILQVTAGDMDTVDLRIRVPDISRLSSKTPIVAGETTIPAGAVIQIVENSGTHRINGILVMVGPGVPAGARIDPASIVDIAPTVLHTLGFPVAEDLDGRVISEAFTGEWLADHPIRPTPTYGDIDHGPTQVAEPTDDLIERLRSLGYIE